MPRSTGPSGGISQSPGMPLDLQDQDGNELDLPEMPWGSTYQDLQDELDRMYGAGKYTVNPPPGRGMGDSIGGNGFNPDIIRNYYVVFIMNPLLDDVTPFVFFPPGTSVLEAVEWFNQKYDLSYAAVRAWVLLENDETLTLPLNGKLSGVGINAIEIEPYEKPPEPPGGGDGGDGGDGGENPDGGGDGGDGSGGDGERDGIKLGWPNFRNFRENWQNFWKNPFRYVSDLFKNSKDIWKTVYIILLVSCAAGVVLTGVFKKYGWMVLLLLLFFVILIGFPIVFTV
jgi:hypothetical protein